VAFTDGQVAELQAQLGSNVDLTDAWVRYQRFVAAAAPDPLRATIEQMVTQRLMDLTAQPAQFNVEGDYSQSTAANIAAYQKQLDRLSAQDEADTGAGLPTLTVGQLENRWSRGGSCRVRGWGRAE
jgi:hypothetical protein